MEKLPPEDLSPYDYIIRGKPVPEELVKAADEARRKVKITGLESDGSLDDSPLTKDGFKSDLPTWLV